MADNNNDIKLFLANVKDAALISCEKGLREASAKILRYLYEEGDWENDTFNLHDSFAWALYKRGKEIDRGYLDSPQATEQYKARGKLSGLIVGGRDQADAFISEYQPRDTDYEVVFVAGMWYANYLEWKGLLLGFINGDVEAKNIAIASIKANFEPLYLKNI